MSAPVTLERHGNVALITIDHPPVNAISHAVRAGLLTAIVEADDRTPWKLAEAGVDVTACARR